MTVTSVTTAKFIADSVILIRDDLQSNITDPLSSRPSGENFVLTSYPKRSVTYPIITVVDKGLTDWRKGGMQSTVSVQRFGIEVRIWGRNVKERDEQSQNILDRLRGQMNAYSNVKKLHDFKIDGWNNVNEPGEQGIKSKVINVSYLEILGE